jgi:rhodanese-related sulfurtransferase
VKLIAMSSAVTAVAAAECAAALAHFEARLRVETDADDVAAALASGAADFVLVDARDAEAYAAGHLPGAHNLARPFDRDDVAALGERLIVVYCWGPGCNGAVKAARELAAMGRAVKEMLGGFEYWLREGHPVEGHDAEILKAATDDQGLVKLRHAVSCLC